ncbi:hypothetical protein PCC7805_03517 [Planktothrix agardhii]|jgi:hypothetical protein|nr:hypothetical protein [Planktothrix agardhii]CAD5966199.1 hypothetical protein PCC7805_03517 [Planktothrix agardhii]
MISFLAQSLDNESPNSITLDGKIILPSEEEKREEILSGIYDIASEKTKIKSVSGVTMYCKASRFVFEVIPLDKDIADRLSPIIILGDFPKEQFSDVWVNDVCDQLVKFASEVLGRTISDSILDIVKEWLSSEMFGFKKKQERREELITLILMTLLPLLVGWFLQAKLSPLPPISQLPPIRVALIYSATNCGALSLIVYLKSRKKV